MMVIYERDRSIRLRHTSPSSVVLSPRGNGGRLQVRTPTARASTGSLPLEEAQPVADRPLAGGDPPHQQGSEYLK